MKPALNVQAASSAVQRSQRTGSSKLLPSEDFLEIFKASLSRPPPGRRIASTALQRHSQQHSIAAPSSKASSAKLPGSSEARVKSESSGLLNDQVCVRSSDGRENAVEKDADRRVASDLDEAANHTAEPSFFSPSPVMLAHQVVRAALGCGTVATFQPAAFVSESDIPAESAVASAAELTLLEGAQLFCPALPDVDASFYDASSVWALASGVTSALAEPLLALPEVPLNSESLASIFTQPSYCAGQMPRLAAEANLVVSDTVFQSYSSHPFHSFHIDVPLQSDRWQAAVSQQLVWMGNQRLQYAKIHLNPPELGPLDVHLTIKEGQSSVSFFSANAAVREALQSTVAQLAQAFATNGLTLNEPSVLSDESLFRQSFDGSSEQNRSQQSPNLFQHSPKEPFNLPIASLDTAESTDLAETAARSAVMGEPVNGGNALSQINLVV